MIKILLKFLILEYCIVVIYQQAEKNFKIPALPRWPSLRQRFPLLFNNRKNVVVNSRKLGSKYTLELLHDVKAVNPYYEVYMKEAMRKYSKKVTYSNKY
jgi:hypothetical protein